MFLPIYDGIALKFVRHATTTMALILANVAIYLALAAGLLGDVERIDLALGLIPASLNGRANLAASIALVEPWMTPLTSIFIHGSIWHLAGNMLFLWVFGDNVEDAMGSLRFLLFYLLCGVIAGLVFAFQFPASRAPLIGASGAISAVAAAYLLLYPRAHVLGLLFNILPLRIPAAVMIGLWALYQLVAAFMLRDGHIAWWAHSGGILAGAILLPLFKRRDVPFFGKRTS